MSEYFTGLHGRRYRYCDHLHNAARTNERAVEVPMALGWIDRQQGRGLEVGNVLLHYRPAGTWTVVDAFDETEGVVQVDIVEYSPAERFDWIVSVSTVEHIGWDYDPPDPDRALAAIEHMRALLAPTGQMLVSFPSGHHPQLDRAVMSGELEPLSSVFMLRVDDAVERSDGTWEERPFEPTRYRSEAWSAGGVWMGVLGPR